MQKMVVHTSGEVTPLKGVTLGNVARFVQMYPSVHIFVADEKILETETLFEDKGMAAFFDTEA